jgi:hypothetical protein
MPDTGRINAVPRSASLLQGLIYIAVEDQGRSPGTCAGADEVIFMPEKHIQRSMISCIGMKGMRCLVICILALTALSGYALAHTPAGVAVSYTESSGDLGVAITHQVEDPTTHYIKQVTVQQGTTVLIDKSYTSQPEKSDFTYLYNLPQLKGSSGEIKVSVECNLAGSRSGTLSLGGTTQAGTPGGATPSPTQAPGCACIALLALGVAATRILR